MKERAFRLHDGKGGAAIAVRVIPRSSHNKIGQILNDGMIVIHLTAPANESKLNQQLIGLLADVLSVPTTQIEIVAGSAQNDKLITITDLDKDSVHARIAGRLS